MSRRWAGTRARLGRASDGTGRGAATETSVLAYPPPKMRALVGPSDEATFDNPTGTPVYPDVPAELYRRVFDFGCGCGRVARQLILQSRRPERHLGVDLHRGMIEWARANLTPEAPAFEFLHHNVYNLSFNPGDGLPDMAPLPADDLASTLVNALSVVTHLTEREPVYYMKEAAAYLRARGSLARSFLPDGRDQFPTMMEHSNALYVSYGIRSRR